MIASRFLRLFSVLFFAGLIAGATAAGAAEHADDGNSGGGQGAEASSDAGRYIELQAITVSIFRNDAPVGQLTAKLTLAVQSPEAAKIVWASRIKLRDAMLREMHRLLEREARNGPKVDLDFLKSRMTKVAQRRLGSDVAVEVLVQAFIRRGA